MSYTINKQLSGDFHEVVEETIEALSAEGFGIITDVDVQQTIKTKLDEEFPKYRILGACNPSLAHGALTEERRLGALLPCNVVVHETTDGVVEVSAIDPGRMLSVVDNPELDHVAVEVTERFRRVLSDLEERHSSKA